MLLKKAQNYLWFGSCDFWLKKTAEDVLLDGQMKDERKKEENEVSDDCTYH